MRSLTILKIGGQVLDHADLLNQVLDAWSKTQGHKILVHGGGKLATQLAEKLGIPQTMIEGRRITDDATLDIAVMVYAGLVNQQLVAGLQSRGLNAWGCSGASGNLILSKKRSPKDGVDYGWVGDVEAVNTQSISWMLAAGICPVFSAITHDGQSRLLNTNADTIAQSLATALAPNFQVKLVYTFEKSGVLLDVENEASVVRHLTPSLYDEMKLKGQVHSGMLPKLDNAFAALQAGVQSVVLGKANALTELLDGQSGTEISL